MKHIAVSVAVAIALFVAFIYGVEFGRKVEHEAWINAKEAIAPSRSSYGNYNHGESYDVHTSEEYDYSYE